MKKFTDKYFNKEEKGGKKSAWWIMRDLRPFKVFSNAPHLRKSME